MATMAGSSSWPWLSPMDLFCCHKRGQKLVRALASRKRLQDERDDHEFNVILTVVRAELPNNGNFMGSANLSVVVRWEGDTSLCDWSVASTPTLWASALEPEWHCALPPQPRVAFRDSGPAQVCFEVVQDFFLGRPAVLAGVAVGPEQLLQDAPLDQPARMLHELQLWRDEDDAGSITVEVVVELATRVAETKALMLQRDDKHSTQGHNEAAMHSSDVDELDSDLDEESEVHASSSGVKASRSRGARSSGDSQRSPSRGPQASARRRASSSESTSSSSASEEWEDEDANAKLLASAMLSQWRRAGGGLGETWAERLKAGSGQIHNPGWEAARILRKVKASVAAKGAPVPMVVPLDSEASLQDLIRRLRVTAHRFPKAGAHLFHMSKEHFFAVAQEEDEYPSSLVLAWYEDKAAWERSSKHLGSIPLVSIRNAFCESKAVGHLVSVVFTEEGDESGKTSQLGLVFKSLAPAEDWCMDLNQIVHLLALAGH